MPKEDSISTISKPSEKRVTYASPQIIARRHRILTETRKMISERGLNNIAVDDIATRADVAKRTIYNAFHSKECLIAAAVQQYYEEVAASLEFETSAMTLEGVIDRLLVMARRNITQLNDTRALLNSFFTPGISPEIRISIYDIASVPHNLWLYDLKKKRQLQPWTDPDELSKALVSFRYSLAFSWTEGHLTGQEFLTALVRNFLTIMAGATRGAARREIETRLADLTEIPVAA